jgi:hypothetical protein
LPEVNELTSGYLWIASPHKINGTRYDSVPSMMRTSMTFQVFAGIAIDVPDNVPVTLDEVNRSLKG